MRTKGPTMLFTEYMYYETILRFKLVGTLLVSLSPKWALNLSCLYMESCHLTKLRGDLFTITHTHSSIKVIVKLSTDLCMYKCCSRLALFPGPVRKIGKKLGLGLGLASSPGPAQFFGRGLGMKLAVGSVHYLYRLLLGGS